jgi:hypothetical protein
MTGFSLCSLVKHVRFLKASSSSAALPFSFFFCPDLLFRKSFRVFILFYFESERYLF